jgi:hypothetical protein
MLTRTVWKILYFYKVNQSVLLPMVLGKKFPKPGNALAHGKR